MYISLREPKRINSRREQDFFQMICNTIHRGFICWLTSYDYSHIAVKYLDNIVEIFRGNIVRLLKYFETYH